MLDRRLAEGVQRAEVVTHRRDVGPGSIRELSERHAVLAAFGDQVERRVQKPAPRPQTRLVTLVHSHGLHTHYSIRRLKTCQLHDTNGGDIGRLLTSRREEVSRAL